MDAHHGSGRGPGSRPARFQMLKSKIMAHSPVNPLYKKKPGETAADHMRRLRKEFPKKFGMQPGTKVVKKKFTAADIAAAEKRGAEKIKAVMRAEGRIEKLSAADAPPAATAETKPVAVLAPPAPAQTPTPTPLDKPMSNPPTATPAPQIVDEAEIFSPAPPPETAAPGSAPPPVPEPTPAGASEPVPGDGKRYAVMIWGAIVKIFCGIFGDGFQPMVLKSETGEVLYDENVEGVKVWLNYLASIGVKAFSPVVELWLFMSMYVGMRFPLIIAKFRKKKPATTATKAGGTGEPPAEAPAPTPAPEKSAAPAPAPASKSTPAAPTPPGTVTLEEVSEEDFR